MHLILNDQNEPFIFFSPIGIQTAFTIVLLGAKARTEDELFTGLGYKAADFDANNNTEIHEAFALFRSLRTNPKDFKLKLANRILINKGFELLEKYTNNVIKYYGSNVSEVDFTNANLTEEVNNWVSNETESAIPQLLTQPPDQDTKMIILNAVYFKGNWKQQFKRSQTKPGLFYMKNNVTAKVPFMHNFGKYRIAQRNLYILLEMKYIGNISMFVVVPNDKNGLYQTTEEFKYNEYVQAIDSLKEVDVDLKLPKFTLNKEYSLKNHLDQLAITDLFSTSADLTGMANKDKLCTTQAIHKTFVDVNEEVHMHLGLAKANNKFAIDMLKIINDGIYPFICFSPIGIQTQLSSLLLDAKLKTGYELFSGLMYKFAEFDDNNLTNVREAFSLFRSTLNEQTKNSKDFALKIATRLLVSKSLRVNQTYKESVSKYFGTSVSEADFTGDEKQRSKIVEDENNWVKQVTNAIIETLLPGLFNETTTMDIMNAVYFQDKWRQPFKPSNTKPDLFHVKKNINTTVPFMSNAGKYKISKHHLFTLIEIKYASDVSFCVMLPNDKNGLDSLIYELNYEIFLHALKSLNESDIFLKLPKFTLNKLWSLEKFVDSLGIRDIFEDSADFSDMVENKEAKGVYITEALHKAVLQMLVN
ncbi:hypothetical protein B4U80_08801 [Leptotrombidium deliense]|uniref:Serpin domain-containing protein n=1 Tax=Leptotrombidium deliense TaxID=299467 RepID=A0A443SLG9_9ACAR|nr:hypothetical protein B4U80_08801 [Leptotrombidium deliense]